MSAGLSTVYVGFLVLMGAIMMGYGINYSFEMGLIPRVGLRIGLTALGLVVMVYPGKLVKIGGIIVFAAVFFLEKVYTGGLRLPFTGVVSR